jgi:NAD(P)-dependent dehydrogenase (short-subunit alcohol dehydrogenase family)
MMLSTLIQGATRGIGLAMAEQLLARGQQVIATGRSAESSVELTALRATYGERLWPLALDITDEASVASAFQQVGERFDKLGCVINAAGLLHDSALGPEKKLEQIDAEAMQRVFAVNTIGPALVMKYAKPLLQHDERSVIANLSARVGSIEDNGLGGWYSYRASKAAQNMLTKTAAIELGRGSRPVIVIALHPGTVETGLSAPCRGGVTGDKLFSSARAARQLLEIIDGATLSCSGVFFAWDGSRIPW